MSAGLINKSAAQQKKRQSADYDGHYRELSEEEVTSPYSKDQQLLESVRDGPLEIGDEAGNYHESPRKAKAAKIKAKADRNNKLLHAIPGHYQTAGHAQSNSNISDVSSTSKRAPSAQSKSIMTPSNNPSSYMLAQSNSYGGSRSGNNNSISQNKNFASNLAMSHNLNIRKKRERSLRRQ